MRDARVALALGLALVAIAAAIVLSQSPQVLTSTNGVKPLNAALTSVPGAGSACQANEVLPARTTAVTLSLRASAGPRVAVTILSGKTVVAQGESASGWIGNMVTIPVGPLDHAVHQTTVCFAFAGANERVLFLGAPTSTGSAARTDTSVLPGRIAIEYRRPGSSSWWSLALSVARHLGLGRAWAGTWVALLAATLMAASIALAAWLAIRDLR
jgi:hypothetical protein